MAWTKEKAREYSKNYYWTHREQMITTSTKWRIEHPDRHSEYCRRHYVTHHIDLISVIIRRNKAERKAVATLAKLLPDGDI
jgi:hypothetical protein